MHDANAYVIELRYEYRQRRGYPMLLGIVIKQIQLNEELELCSSDF